MYVHEWILSQLSKFLLEEIKLDHLKAWNLISQLINAKRSVHLQVFFLSFGYHHYLVIAFSDFFLHLSFFLSFSIRNQHMPKSTQTTPRGKRYFGDGNNMCVRKKASVCVYLILCRHYKHNTVGKQGMLSCKICKQEKQQESVGILNDT